MTGIATAEFSLLREPARIGPMVVPNRIMMAPMERNFATADGAVSTRTLLHYAERAAGGVGWIDIEATFVAAEGRGRIHQLGLHSDAMVGGFSRLVEACHAHGAKVSVELHHAGRHASRHITGIRPVCPSELPSPESGGELCTPLDTDQVMAVLGKYGDAARRAIDAGVDAVELHGAHGYLVHQFLSERTNQRDDDFGGSPSRRQEFAVRAVAALRQAVGNQSVAVGCRLSVTEAMDGGFTEEFIADLGVRLRNEGVDYLSLNAGTIESPSAISPPMGSVEQGWLVPIATRLRAEWRIPVVLAGRFLDLHSGEAALRDGAADVIAYGRALLADPSMVIKTLNGEDASVTPCIGCNQGCVARIGQQLDATCTVNPRMGRETLEVTLSIRRPHVSAGRVLVAGGGPAGMVAALEAHDAGFEVELFEATSKLGGNLRLACVEPGREGWGRYLSFLESRLASSAVKVTLGTPLDPTSSGLHGDVLVVATGAKPVLPRGVRAPDSTLPVLNFADAIENVPAVGDRCVVIGGDATAVGTALSLTNAGVNVVAIVGTPPSSTTLGGLDEAISQLRRSGCAFVTDKSLSWMGSRTVRMSDVDAILEVSEETLTGIDSVVLCAPRVPINPWSSGTAEGFAEVYCIGEALLPGDVRSAVADAYEVVRGLRNRDPRASAVAPREFPNSAHFATLQRESHG